MSTPSRRDLLLATPGVSLAAAVLCGVPIQAAQDNTKERSDKSPIWPGFPRQDAKLVREIVGAAHFNEARVKELVEAKPALVNAWWDWGFGDWESPLGAAAHVGRRAIAEFLIERGARIDIFAAAMLGMTDVVKSFVSAQPGVQRTLGPHGIPLLAHAKVGGEHAAKTLAYLDSLGDAGTTLKTAALADDRKSTYVGTYVVEGAAGERLEVKLSKKSQLQITTSDQAARNLHFLGNEEFFPSGVPSVRLRFDVRDGKARAFTLSEREPMLTAKRVGD